MSVNYRTRPKSPELCQWFAMCGHLATTTIPHPILGPVPACGRCEARHEAMSA